MASQGLSSQDLRQRAQVLTLKRNGSTFAAPVDPIEDAMRIRRQMAAAKLLDLSLSDTSAEAIEAENRRLKAEIEQAKLKAEVQAPSATANGEWQQYIMANLEKVQDELANTQKALTEQQMGALNERIGILAGELQRVQSERQETANPIQSAKQMISEAQELVALITPAVPEAPPAPPPGGNSIAVTAYLKRLELDQERWRAAREDEISIKRAQLELDREMRSKELEVKVARDQRMDRFFSETAPKLISVGEQLLSRLLQAGGEAALPVVAAPAVAPQVMPALEVPPDYLSGACPKCGNVMFYREHWPEVICQRCGALFGNEPDHPAEESHA